MRVALAYIGVVLIWSTTPLGVKWSNSSLHFSAAAGLRMTLAFLVCAFVLAYRGRPLFQNKSDCLVFLAGALTLFPTMALVYWSAQHISSGMIAVVFGIYPFFVGVFAKLFGQHTRLTTEKVIALAIAISGLAVIQFEQFSLGEKAAYGVAAVLLATLIFALATLWMKNIGGNVDPFRQNTGVLMFALPGFIAAWYFNGAPAPEVLDTRSMIGVAYLVICGTVVGATLFFYVLRHCSALTTSLIPLMTPMLAIYVGVAVDGEVITTKEIVGSLMIVSSLGLYQGVWKRLRSRARSVSPDALSHYEPGPEALNREELSELGRELK